LVYQRKKLNFEYVVGFIFKLYKYIETMLGLSRVMTQCHHIGMKPLAFVNYKSLNHANMATVAKKSKSNTIDPKVNKDKINPIIVTSNTPPNSKPQIIISDPSYFVNNPNICPETKTNINRTYSEFRQAFRNIVFDTDRRTLKCVDDVMYVQNVNRYISYNEQANKPIIFNNQLSWLIIYHTIKSMFNDPTCHINHNTFHMLKLTIGSIFPMIIAGACGMSSTALPVVAFMYPVYSLFKYNSEIARALRYYEQLVHDDVDMVYPYNSRIALENIKGNMLYVKQMVKFHRDINKTHGPHGKTILHYATHYYWPHITQYLVESGANVNCKDNFGNTPLHDAASNGDVEMMEYLIAHGANVNVQYPDGKTPLHRAVYFKRQDAVKCLLDNGADRHMKDKSGKDAFEAHEDN